MEQQPRRLILRPFVYGGAILCTILLSFVLLNNSGSMGLTAMHEGVLDSNNADISVAFSDSGIDSNAPGERDLSIRSGEKAMDSDKPVAMVTGITGMIGSYVAKALIKTKKYRVVGIVRYRSDLNNLAGYLSDIKLLHGDINDKGRMRDIVMSEKPAYIYHFAAQAINGVSYDSAELTLETNIKGMCS